MSKYAEIPQYIQDLVAARAEIKRLCEKAGVADAHWHDLRATSLTLAKEAQGLDYAKTLAGHASARMTESYIAQRSVTKVRPIR